MDGPDASTLVTVDGAARPSVLTFEVFYRSTRDKVAAALALATGSAELGAEAADEAMARAVARWSQLEGMVNPAGWVYRVGLNWARSAMRRRRDAPAPAVDRSVEAAPIADPAVHRALGALPLGYRAVVVCRLYLDWDVETTAAALGVSPGTVKSRLNRALVRLRAEIKES